MLRSMVVLAAVVGATSLAHMPGQFRGPIRTEPPAEPGNSATLTVVAPESLCADQHELIVARTTSSGRRYVFQAPVAPPQCQWTIPDVRPGDYQAVLQRARGDRRVVAMSRLDVHPGSAWTTTIAPLAATVEGLISVQGVPVGRGTYVEVRQNGGPGWSWDTRTGDDGFYEIRVVPDEGLCVRVTLPDALNFISSPCRGFGPGGNRRDFDIPPGRIDVTLVPRDDPIHETPLLLVLERPGRALSTAISVTGRIQRPFVGLESGKYRIRATTVDYSHDFDAADVELSMDQPVKAITLSVPFSR